MGIFSFFSRKTHNKKKATATAASLRAHACNTSGSGSHPIQGVYPVAGNGPNVLDTLSQGRTNYSQTNSSQPQLSLNASPAEEDAAPAPGIPWHRDDSSERPSTAPNGRPPSLSFSGKFRKPAGQKRAPPVSFRMARTDSTIPESRPASHGSEYGSTGFSQGTCVYFRSNSLRSNGGRGFRDILDAHSEIRPADFRERVKAAGARDYGEDVAERNMGMNGFDLESDHVKAFYAHSIAPQPEGPTTRSLAQSKSRTSMRCVSSTKTKWPGSTSQPSLPKALAGQLPGYKSADTVLYNDKKTSGGGHLKRRVSVNTYMPPTSVLNNAASNASLASWNRADGVAFGQETSRLEMETPVPAGSPLILGPPNMVKDVSSSREFRIPRDSVMLAKKKRVIVSGHTVAGETSPERTFSIRSATTTDSCSHRRRASTISCASASASTYSPRKRQSLHTLQSSISSSILSHEPSVHTTTPLAYPRHNFPHPRQQQHPDVSFAVLASSANREASVDLDDAAAAAARDSMDCVSAPSHRSPSMILEEDADTSSTTARPSPRSVSLVVVQPRRSVVVMEDYHHYQHNQQQKQPFQRHRGMSASSSTPTMVSGVARSSSLHSSRQTTNTSVDSSASPSLKPSISITQLSPPSTPHSNNFNMDDYISSDDDESLLGGSGNSSQRRRKPTGAGEEDLLFKDIEGYGGSGLQLPGLFDPFPDLNPSSNLPQRTRARSSGPEPKFAGSYNGIGGSFGSVEGRKKRFILDTAAHSDDCEGGEEEDHSYNDRETEEEEDAMDGLSPVRGRRQPTRAFERNRCRSRDRAQGRAKAQAPETRRLDALYGDPNEEEEAEEGEEAQAEEGSEADGERNRDEERAEAEIIKVDVAAAVRLRKQVKKAKRLERNTLKRLRVRKAKSCGSTIAHGVVKGEEGPERRVEMMKSVPVLYVSGKMYQEDCNAA